MTGQKTIDAAGFDDPLETVTRWLATRQSERPSRANERDDRIDWFELFRREPNDDDADHRERLLWHIREIRGDETMEVADVIIPVVDALEPGDDIEAARRWVNQLQAQAEHDQADLDAMEALLLGSTIERVQHSYSVAAWRDRHDG